LKPQIPWLRIGIEGVVIVGSILLAFGLQAWWDGRQDRSEEERALQGLELEFVANRSQLDTIIRFHERAGVLVEQLEGMPESVLSELPADSIDLFLRAMYQARTFDAFGASLDGVLGAGRLGLIHDQTLSDLLIAWAGRLEDSKEEGANLIFASVPVIELLASYGGPYLDYPGLRTATADDLAALRRDAEVTERVRLKLWWGDVYAEELQGLADMAEEALGLIRATRR
jgi:hypothetical protein